METILRTEKLCKYYGRGSSAVKAVDNVDISIGKGEFVSVIGKSGSGKSTLLHLLGGLDRPTSGRVFLSDIDLYSVKEDKLAVIRRRRIGFIFQAFNLVSSLNVWENVVLPLGLDDRKVNREWVTDVLETLGIESKTRNLPETLSGGQQQRVAIARAMATRSPILMADEPTGALDSKTGAQVLSLMRQLNAKGTTVILITHDNGIAAQADRTIRVMDGHIVHDSLWDGILVPAEAAAGVKGA